MSFAVTSQLATADSVPGFFALALMSEPYRFPHPALASSPVGPSSSLGKTLPVIARVFDSTGVNFITSFSVRELPQLKFTINGSAQPITLHVKDQATVAQVGLGNIVQVAEQGGDNTILYIGTVETAPIQYGDTTDVYIELDPIGSECGKTDFNKSYTVPTDVAQWVLDAVAATGHLWATPQSVPMTGIFATNNFTKSHVSDVLDQARTMAGSDFYWYVAPNGRVWFQSMGSTATYTLKQQNDYNVSKTAPTITPMRNKFTVIGGVAPGSDAILTSDYSDPVSQQQYGIRTMQPNPYYPDITTQVGLDAIKTTLGSLLNRVFQKTSLHVVNYPGRVWMDQPGGALIRYWEPAKPPQPQAISGSGTYSPTLFVRDVDMIGPTQELVLDTMPVNIDDLDAMMHRIAARATTWPMLYMPSSLNTPVTMAPTGSVASTNNAAKWIYDTLSIRASDGSATDYGAPSGPGYSSEIDANGTAFFAKLLLQSAKSGARFSIDSSTGLITIYDPNGTIRCQLGNLGVNGISPAQWGARVNDASGSPIFDSQGLIGVMQQLGYANLGASNATTTTPTTIAGSGVSFTVTRPSRIFYILSARGFSVAQDGIIEPFIDGVSQYPSALRWGVAGPLVTSSWALTDYVAAGSHTIDLRAFVSNAGGTLNWVGATLDVYLEGSS